MCPPPCPPVTFVCVQHLFAKLQFGGGLLEYLFYLALLVAIVIGIFYAFGHSLDLNNFKTS